ncbi:MAG: hypothetical protein KGQ89_11680, partial [Verrucomicrobia bacterium]|nr:hypothetical protein [Verrucomicrobiota bacterium]
MPIWDIISTASTNYNLGLLSDLMEAADTSSYTCTFGDQTSFVIGGTQAYNAIGSSINLTIDWEELVAEFLSWGKPSLVDGSPLWLWFRGLLLGIGGNADLVVGNDSSFNYCGESFSVNRNGHEFTCTVPTGSGMPNSVMATLGLGSLSLIGASILTRFLYGLGTEADSTIASNTLILELIPELESTWLEILKLVEFSQSLFSSITTDIQIAETSLASARAALGAATTAQEAAAKTGQLQVSATLEAMVNAETNNVRSYEFLLANEQQAQKSGLSALIARQRAAAKEEIPIVTQVTADQYYLASSSIMATTQKGPILLMAQDYENPPGTKAYGGITLNASQIGFTAQGSASITMNRQDFNTNLPPNISLMTMGNTSSAISLIAQQKTDNSSMASITAGTNEITLSFGSNVPANSFTTQMTSKDVTIKQNLENGPQIQLDVDSIKLSV